MKDRTEDNQICSSSYPETDFEIAGDALGGRSLFRIVDIASYLSQEPGRSSRK